MSTEPAGRIRASDDEREEYARITRDAVSEGRLTLGEGDERLAQIYATRYRDELRPLVSDLPSADPTPARQGPNPMGPPMPFRRGLARHAAFVAVIAAALVGLWAISGAHFFWPAIPLFFLVLSLSRHARWGGYWGGGYRRRYWR